MRLVDFLDAGAQRDPSAVCFSEGGRHWTFAEAIDMSHRIANAFRRDGLVPGDRVGVLAANSASGLMCILGLLRAEATLVALNLRNPAPDNAAHVRRCGVTWLLHDVQANDAAAHIQREAGEALRRFAIDGPEDAPGGLHEWLADSPATPRQPATPEAADGIWRLSLTGGTTGTPKRVEQTFRSAELTVATILALFHYEQRPTYLLAAPMTHAGGMFVFAYLAMGGRIVILPRPQPDAILDAIHAEGVNALFLPTTSLYDLLSHPRVHQIDRSSLRHFLVGASPLSPDRLAEAMDVFGPVMAQGFGQTEGATLLTYMSPSEYEDARRVAPHRLRSCGRATPFVRVAVMDNEGQLLPPGTIGEIVVRSGMVMRAYRDDPEETARAQRHGWHHTGDIGTMDDQGYVTLLDRQRDLIITGGFNVFPSEVERAMTAHPAVHDCAVVGVPDDRWGEAVKAVVQLRAGVEVDVHTLQSWCRERLGGVKAPKSVEIWSELPRSAVGKVLRREVRKRFWTTDRQI